MDSLLARAPFFFALLFFLGLLKWPAELAVVGLVGLGLAGVALAARLLWLIFRFRL